MLTAEKLKRLERASKEATAYCAKQGKKMQVVRDVRRHGSYGFTATTTNLTCTASARATSQVM